MMTYALIFGTLTSTMSLPPGLLSAVCYVETKHKIVIVENDGGSKSIGLCQIKYNTAKYLGYKGTEKGLINPKVNAYWAAKYLKYQLNRYEGNHIKAIAAYNAGSHRLNKRGEIKNRHYVHKVLKAWGEGR